MNSDAQDVATEFVREYLREEEFSHQESAPGTFVVELPGEKKLRTTVSLAVGKHSMTVNAFVARQPDENHAVVYRWLLERNRRLFGIAYALDHLGDVYLVGRLSLAALSPETLDQLLGSVLDTADGDFNTILGLGFSSAIEAEWRWRLDRGESTRNLDEFRHLAPADRATPRD